MSQASDPPLIFKQGAGLLNQVQFWWRPPIRTYGIGISTYTLSCPELNYNMQFQSKAITAVIPIANNGVDYYFNITATNVYGLTSNPAYFNRVSAGVRPDIISTISVNLVSSFYATVRWTTVPSIPNQQSVHSYLVCAVPASGGSTIRFANYITANSYNFIGFTSSYYFFVRAVGTGALYSLEAPSTSVIAMGIPPGPAGNITTGVLDPNTVTISWDDDGTSTDYEFEIIPDDGSPPFKVVPSTINGKTATFPGCGGWTGYPNGPGYVIRIICIGGGGLTSTDSAPVYFGSKPPSDVTYADVKASSFTLVWYGAAGANNFQFSLDKGSTIINNDWSPVPYGSSVVGSTIFTGLHIGSSFSGAIVYALNFNSSIITASRPPYSSFVLRPGDIVNLEPSFISQSSFTLNWTGVETASSIVYGGAQPTSTNGILGPSVFTGLSTGTTYTISLTPMDPAGPGHTTTITVETLAKPVDPITQGDGSLSTLSISWDGTLGSDYYVPLVNGVYGLPVSKYLSSVVITDLEPDTLYNIAIVTYQNVWSTTFISSVSNYITFRTAPAVPVPPTITSTIDTSFVASWSTIAGITYSFTLNGVLYSPVFSPYTFSSLTANTSYVLVLRATNSGGTTPSNPITIITHPGAATNLGTSSIGLSSFTLTWSDAIAASSFLFSLDSGISYTSAPWYPNPYGSATGGYAVFTGLETGKQFAGVIIYSLNTGGIASSIAISSLTLLPGAATNMTPSLISQSSFTLSWDGVAGAASLTYLGNVPPTYTNDVLGPAVYTDLVPGSYYSTIIITNNAPGSTPDINSTLVKTTPPKVSSITQSSGAWSTLNIAWSSAFGAESYGYIIGDLYSGPIYNSSIQFISVGGLLANTTYSTTIVCYDIVWPTTGWVGSTISNYVSLTTGPQFPIVSVSYVSISTFVVSWAVISNCTYAITGSLVRSGITSPYTVSSLLANTTYNYTVIATNVYGVTPSSFSITTGPTQPLNLSSSGYTAFSFKIHWTDGIAATSYLYYIGGIPVTALTDNGVSGYNVTLGGLFPNSTYSVVVASANVNGINPSVPLSVKTGPGPAINLTTSAVSSYQFSLSWGGAEGVSSYTFHCGANSFTTNAAFTTQPYTFSSLTFNTTYNVWVETTNSLANTSSINFNQTTGPAPVSGLVANNLGADFFSIGYTGGVGATSLRFHYNNSTIVAAVPTLNPFKISSLAIATVYVVYIDSMVTIPTTSSLVTTYQVVEISSMNISQRTGLGPATLSTYQATATGFSVYWSDVDIASSITFFYNGTSVTVQQSAGPVYITTGLLPNTLYSLSAFAINSYSSSLSLVYYQLTGPSPPTNVTIGQVRANQVSMSWTGGVTSSFTFHYGTSNVTVSGSTVSPYLITGLAPNTNYVFYIEVTNSVGNASSVSVNQTTGPAPATGIYITNVSSSSFAVNWTGASGASSLTFLYNGSAVTASVTSAVSPFTLTGLSAHTDYVVYMNATNSIANTSSGTVSQTTAPSAHTGLGIGTVTGTSIAVSWTGGGAASSFTFHYGPNTVTVPGSTTSPYTITGLSPNTNYIISIDATSPIGNASSVVINQTTGPAAPTGVSLTGVTISSFFVNWSGPSGASSITFNYNASAITLPVASAISPYNIIGLLANTTYIVNVVGTNSIGSGISDYVSTLTLPMAPSNITFNPVTGTTICINWTGGAASSYTIHYGSSTFTIAGNTPSPVIISSLSSNTDYIIYIDATSPAGNTSSLSSNRTTGPAAPTNLSISNVQSQQFDVAWSGAEGATALTFYYNSSNLTVNTPVTSPRTLSGLSVNTPYTVYMVASNTNGATSSLSVNQTTGPGAPTNIVASGIGDTYFSVGWSGAAGASSLTFTYGGTSFTANASGVQNPYPFTSGLTVGTTYIVYIVAQNSICANSSLGLSVTTVFPPPPQPTNLQQSAASNSDVTITWSQQPPITSYTWYRDQWSAYPTAIGNVRTLTVGGFGNDTETVIFLKPINSNINGPQANITCYTNPSVPSLTQASAGYTSVTVSVNPFRSFYQYTYSCNGQNNVDFTGNPNPTVNFSNPASGVTFFMTVKNGNFASQQNSIVVNTQPAQPSGLQQTGATTNSVSVSWNSLSGALTGLNWNVGGGPSGSLSNNATSYNISGLNSNTQYYNFNLYAVNNSVSSSPASIAITTNPDTPTLSQQSATYNSVTISVNYYGYYQYTYSYDGGSYTGFSGNSFTINTGNAVSGKSLTVRATNGSFGSASATLNINTAPAVLSISQNAVTYSSFTVNISGYQNDTSNTLYWSGSDGTSGNVGISGKPATQLVTSGISQAGSITYSVYVNSQNSYGLTNSNQINVTTSEGPPPIADLYITDVTATTAYFGWTHNSRVYEYIISEIVGPISFMPITGPPNYRYMASRMRPGSNVTIRVTSKLQYSPLTASITSTFTTLAE